MERLRGRYDRAVELRQASRRLARRPHHRWFGTAGHVAAGTTLLELGRTDEAVDLLTPAARPAEHDGAEAYLLRCLAPLAEATGSRAVLDEADALLAAVDAPRRHGRGCSAPTSTWPSPGHGCGTTSRPGPGRCSPRCARRRTGTVGARAGRGRRRGRACGGGAGRYRGRAGGVGARRRARPPTRHARNAAGRMRGSRLAADCNAPQRVRNRAAEAGGVATSISTHRDAARLLWGLTGAAWLVLLALRLVPHGHLAHPAHAVAGVAAGVAWPLVIAAFAGGWLVMVAAMMLPTTVPMARMFTVVSAGHHAPAPGAGRVLHGLHRALAGLRRRRVRQRHRAAAAHRGRAARPDPGGRARAGRRVPVQPAQAALPDRLPRAGRVPVRALPPRGGRRVVSRAAARAGPAWAAAGR